jgi:osmotically-inducible protein OsmY
LDQLLIVEMGGHVRTDKEIKQDVERELEWEPRVGERRVGVAVVDGIVTLTGEVRSLSEQWEAQRTAERVSGVRGVANDTSVRAVTEQTDTDLARAAANAITWNSALPQDRLKVEVNDAWLTLKGEVERDYQRRSAETSVRQLRGIRGITNDITITVQLEPDDLKQRIENALRRQAQLDANRISIQASGGEVTLRGNVGSMIERRVAENATWNAPGVHAVHDYIAVDAAP